MKIEPKTPKQMREMLDKLYFKIGSIDKELKELIELECELRFYFGALLSKSSSEKPYNLQRTHL